MSIPPLVCSTPPPPDQCEDDKDPDDFDLHYNLSQEDDDETYGYGDFANYNDFQSSTSVNQMSNNTSTKSVENEGTVSNEQNSNSNESEHGINTMVESKLKFEEDINIEDLGLKVDQETAEVTNVTLKKNDCMETESDSNREIIEKEIRIPNNTNVNDDELKTSTLPKTEYVIVDTQSIGNTDVPTPTYINEIDEDPNNLQVDINETNIVLENVPSVDKSKENTVIKNIVEPLNTVSDDDFGDFDDFQVAGTSFKTVAAIDDCDNPWVSKESDDHDFGDFTANFNESESNTINLPEITIVHSNEQTDIPKDVNDSGDNDFGDFDDFQTSANEPGQNIITQESMACQQVPMFDLESPGNENQIIESINNVISSIFQHEIPEPETEFDGKLESLLCETWGHLLETDVRQPYIVNWNNSLGQKTLLKALCIDSRNILFGPKWNYNMPKYAVNLSTAPLQPQKQSTSPNVSQTDSATSDKTGTSTWSDPFSSDGQESTYAETLLLDLEHLMATLDQMAHIHSTLKISELLSQASNTDNADTENPVMESRPTDLDVFEATVPSKPDKIFSSTLKVQPLRQINLPDTHIFTPTDSETPRSKTIHYDSRPTVLLPQTVSEDSKRPSENLSPQPSCSSASNNLEDDNEYWEFQDYKGASIKLPQDASNQPTRTDTEIKASEKPQSQNVTYGTQVLLPIKVEPIIPTLNWPDPGEVKETFEDFSDFVSNSSSSWSNEKQEIPSNPVAACIDNIKTSFITKAETSTNAKDMATANDSFDDEFDTFQSALPPKIESNFKDLNTDSNSSATQTASNKRTELNKVFPKDDSSNSDTIAFANTIKSKDNILTNPTPFVSNNFNNINKSEQTGKSSVQPLFHNQLNNILQPTVASSSSSNHNQQKSAQILQPLSLESYSQINWPNPGIDLQDLSRFNPVETLRSLKSDLSSNSHSKVASPVHNQKSTTNTQGADDDIWGEFVSSKPKQQQALPKKSQVFVDDDEWTDFVSSPSVNPQNGLNTISLNVHTNLNIQKSSNQIKFTTKTNQIPLDIPSLNYITPKSSTHKSYNDRHFQNL